MTSTKNKRDGRHGTVIMASSSRCSLDLAAKIGIMRAARDNEDNNKSTPKVSDNGKAREATPSRSTSVQGSGLTAALARLSSTRSASRESASVQAVLPLLAPPGSRSRPRRSQSGSGFDSKPLCVRPYSRVDIPKKAVRRPR